MQDKDNSQLTDFEKRVLLEVCNADPSSEAALTQFKQTIVTSREYTGCGVFVHLRTAHHNTKIKSEDRIMPGSSRIILKHPQIDHDADVIVWLIDGIIDCLEMVTFGEDKWPKSEELFEIFHLH